LDFSCFQYFSFQLFAEMTHSGRSRRPAIFRPQQQQQKEREENDLRQTPELRQLPVAHVNTSPCSAVADAALLGILN